MGKESKLKKPENLGKGKVTPVQVAFIVDCYLSDNNFTTTLEAFRSEASHLFSKTKSKEAPKGLMGLGEILDEYINLKEQKLIVDQEKRRVEIALKGIQDVMQAYYSIPAASTVLLPSSPPFIPNHFVCPPTAPVVPVNVSPPGQAVEGTPSMSSTQVPAFPFRPRDTEYLSTPVPSSSNKRKTSKPAPRVLPPSKKACVQSFKDPSSSGVPARMENTTADKSVAVSVASSSHQGSPSAQESLAAKNLLKRSTNTQANSSPKTPPQELPSQSGQSGARDNSSVRANIDCDSHVFPASNCSIVSSKTIIVSPHRGKGCYTVQRSYSLTSPLKSGSEKPSIRDHVKGRLDFDADVSKNQKELVRMDGSSPSTDGDSSETFDFDLPDLDLFNSDFSLQGLLIDLDLDCEAVPSQSTSGSADLSPGHGVEEVAEKDNVVADQGSPMTSLQAVAGVLSKDARFRGPDLVTSVKTVTKCIIVSPAKAR